MALHERGNAREEASGAGDGPTGGRRLPAWARYALAFAWVAAATAATSTLFAALGAENVRVVSAFYFFAVFASAWFGGAGPGLFSVATSALAISLFFFAPAGQLTLRPTEVAQTSVFILVSSLIVFLAERGRRSERHARRSEAQLATTLRSIGDAVIATDRHGQVRFMNPVAEQLTGWTLAEATGLPLHEVFRVINERTRQPVESPVEKVLREGMTVGLANHTVLIARDGREIPVEDSGAPVRGPRGNIRGVVLVFHDVTAGRRAEAERELLAVQVESERGRLRDIVGSVPGVVWEAWGQPDERVQRINFVSDHVERMLGYTVEEWTATPNFWLQIVHPEDRERAAAHAAEHFTRGGPDVNLFRWVTKDGRVLHVESHSTVVQDEEGRPLGMRGVTLDVTGRKEAEEQLREREGRYRALADAMPQIVWTARPDGYFDYFNRRWFEYTGRGYEETWGWDWQRVLHPLDGERLLRAWATCVETGRDLSVQARLLRADGQYRWHLTRAEPMRDERGAVTRWFGTSTDIHDQKQAEERLTFLVETSGVLASSLDYETTLDRLARLAVNALGDYCLIDVVGGDGRFIRVGAAHQDPEREPLVVDLRRFPPDPSRADGIPRVLRTGETLSVSELTGERLRAVAQSDEHAEALRRLGVRAFVSVPLVARERIIGALTCGITEEGRNYTPDDISFAQELAGRAALAIDNARLYGEARAANRSKDEFLATLSHELRTPLTPVIGWTHMIRGGHLGPGDVANGMRVIQKNAESLSRLINDLLDMSSIMSGKMRIERAAVELGAALREAGETVRPQAEARGVWLELQTGGLGKLNVSGDRTRLVQVFWNLLNNAVKFTPEGGRVSVRLAQFDGSARVEVEDDGAGIPPEFLPHVFERFRQADGSTTRTHGGLGIGLALVKSFVEAHGGSVAASSDGPGRGSRFSVTLPLIPAPAAPSSDGQPTTAEAEPCAEEVCRILLIEDAPDTLDMLRVVFEGRGYTVAACLDAESALSAAETEHFDLVVSDIGLPRLDGYELIRRLRSLPHMGGAPAIALTGYAAPKDAAAARDAGFDTHLPKPVDPAALTAEVERLLQARASAEAE
ncbi:MAG TPA: PAS domain S-box protein [Pyrinomonadaceae bacterium]|nr:PAS domain S-box protein [Pyrinomonadaceae bacterium]